MGCGCGSSCASKVKSSSAANKLSIFDWLDDISGLAGLDNYNVVEVRFKGTRKEYYKNIGGLDLVIDDYVILEEEGGYDVGRVSLTGELVKLQLKKTGIKADTDFKRILRKANDTEIDRHKENLELEVPTMYKARTFAMELGLSMKLSDVEYRGDRRKATFFYTADDRVDFRELIKKLAEAFKVRIEMRQIGYRQEAGRLGGIGSCGRKLCCSTWLSDFKVVHTNSAKSQNLSLNQSKLLGQCGKLKCCLNHELDAYVEAGKEFPDEDNLVLEFANGGFYRTVKTDILKRTIWFAPKGEVSGDWIALDVHKVKEYFKLNKEGVKPELVAQVKVEKTDKEPVLDFTNDMGVGSLTRLDEKEKQKKSPGKNKGRWNKKNKPKGGNPTPPKMT